eukprot:9366106-Alexandrium_andersonii.AAC.1
MAQQADQAGRSFEQNLGPPEVPSKLPTFGVEPEPGTPEASAGRGDSSILSLKLLKAAQGCPKVLNQLIK